MSKMFTAVAIGQLVDKKLISFNDTVGRFFPNYPNEVVRENVTIAMLLSHTSGMGDFLAKRTPEMMKTGVDRAVEFMPLYDKDDLLFRPGKDWSYSNADLALAGAIVETVSGEAYPEYIRKHIFAVAGMTLSDPNNHPLSSATLVKPYTKLTENGSSPDWREAEHDIGSPAGGAISTTNDLLRFADALRSGKLVSKATFIEMATDHGSMPSGEKYGYAMQIETIYGQTTVGYGGDFPGVGTRLYILLGTPYVIVVLSNQDSPARLYGESRIVALIAEKAKLEK
jgi:CubicO group peptidase (beta-lactamase class C family)